jgi:hypothetical protein
MYSGGTVTCVLSELLENLNYLHLAPYMISTDIFVAFKFRKKLYIDKLWSLLMVNKIFLPLDFNYLNFHYYENVQLI